MKIEYPKPKYSESEKRFIRKKPLTVVLDSCWELLDIVVSGLEDDSITKETALKINDIVFRISVATPAIRSRLV